MDKIERNLAVEERIREVNKNLHPNPSNFQTSAPIVSETNSQKLYMTIQDLETLKKSVMDFSKDYSNEFSNLLSYFEKIIDDYDTLIKKIESLKSYIESIELNFNKNKGKINGEEVEDITYYTDHERENSYYHEVLLPKLTAIYENSVNNATNIIEANIVEVVSRLEENEVWKSINKESFLDSINYYEHFDSVVNTQKAYKIEKISTVSGEISDNGTTQISKADPTKYNRIKAITKGNEIVEVTVLGTNAEAGGVIVETTGALDNFNTRVSDNNPIFPELFKSEATSLKNGFISDAKANFNNYEFDVEERIDQIYSDMKELATITYDGENKSKIYFNDDFNVVSFGDGTVFVNGTKASFKVSNLYGYLNSVIAVTEAGEFYAIGDNTYNRLGVGKNHNFVSDWTKLNITPCTKEWGSVYIGYYFSSIITDDGVYVAGDTEVCSANEAFNFTKVHLENGVYPIFKHQLIDGKGGVFIYQTEDKKIYICGNNEKGQCGIVDSDFVKYPTYLNIADDINFISFSNKSTYILDKKGNLFGAGNNDHGQLGKRYDQEKDYVKTFKTIMNNVKFMKAVNSGLVIIDNTSELYVCGDNVSGRFGIGTLKPYNELTHVRSMDEDKYIQLKNGVISVDLEADKMFVNNHGKLWVAGKNEFGDLGLGHTNQVKDLTAISDDIGTVFGISLYKGISAVVTSKDRETEWYLCGNNEKGQCGVPETTIVTKFTASGVKISSDFSHSRSLILNITKDNSYIYKEDENTEEVYVCGLNQYGELGQGNRNKVENFTKISVENSLLDTIYHSATSFNIYTDENENVWFAGSNIFAQSGNGEKENYITSFTKIENLKCKYGFVYGNTIFIITPDDDLYTFGDNFIGNTGVEGNEGTSIGKPTKSGFDIEGKTQVAEIDSELVIIEDEI
ncbi:MAG: hypothetical protein IJ772_05160 [Bacilli bacterium]|nr:hypothetical protein [Bacilli bacterium]